MKTDTATLKSNERKVTQLMMSIGKANAILKKDIMFMLVKKCGMDTCYQCNKPIEHVSEFSIEHKKNWMNSEDPNDLYFDVDNIAFSHRSCNIAAARTLPKEIVDARHPSNFTYQKGCRCRACTDAHNIYNSKYYKRKV